MASIAQPAPAGDLTRTLTMPLLARSWLTKWRAIGGDVTIARSGAASPWRFEVPGDEEALEAEHLLDEFGTTPGMPAAVRGVMRAEALMTQGGRA